MFGEYIDVDGMTEAEAATELLARHLDSMGVVIEVGFNAATGTVAFVTEGPGVHLANVYADYDADVHLVCEPGEIKSGPLAGEIEDGTVYANFSVRGVSDTPEGFALPMYAPTRRGAVLHDRESVSDRVWALGEAAGLALDG